MVWGVWCIVLYKFDTHQPIVSFVLFCFSLGNIARRISEMDGVFGRVVGRGFQFSHIFLVWWSDS